jgi:hypothetical protein
MLRIPHCLNNRLKYGSKVVSPTHRQRSTPQKHYFSASGTHFCWRLSDPQGLVLPKGLGKFKQLIPGILAIEKGELGLVSSRSYVAVY